MLLKRFLLFLNDVLLYSPLVKSYLCLIGLFSCSANFITRFIIPPPCIFFLFYSTKLCIPMRKTRIFSLFFICLGLDAFSLHHVLSKKRRVFLIPEPSRASYSPLPSLHTKFISQF